MNTIEICSAILGIQDMFELNYIQQQQLLKSEQLDHILTAAHWMRWDQVTVMLYQDDILERKTQKAK